MQDTSGKGPQYFKNAQGVEIVNFYAEHTELNVDLSQQGVTDANYSLDSTTVHLNHCLAEEGILILGFKNVLRLEIPHGVNSYQMNCSNGSLYKTRGTDTLAPHSFYILSESRWKPVLIDIFTDQGEFKHFEISSHPMAIPEIFINNALIYDSISAQELEDSLHLSVDYSVKTCITTDFTITDWRLDHPDEYTLTEGNGNIISPQDLQALKGINMFVLVCGIKGKDGVTRYRKLPLVIRKD